MCEAGRIPGVSQSVSNRSMGSVCPCVASGCARMPYPCCSGAGVPVLWRAHPFGCLFHRSRVPASSFRGRRWRVGEGVTSRCRCKLVTCDHGSVGFQRVALESNNSLLNDQEDEVCGQPDCSCRSSCVREGDRLRLHVRVCASAHLAQRGDRHGAILPGMGGAGRKVIEFWHPAVQWPHQLQYCALGGIMVSSGLTRLPQR